MTAARRLTSLQVAGFVADGALRFDGIVPRALSDAALAELAGGGPPSPFGADPASPAAGWSGRPLAGLFRDWPALTAVLELPAVAAVIESLLGPDPIYDHHYAHVIARAQRMEPALARRRDPRSASRRLRHPALLLLPRHAARDGRHDVSARQPPAAGQRIRDRALPELRRAGGDGLPGRLAAGLPPRHLALRPAEPDRPRAHDVQAAPESARAAAPGLGHRPTFATRASARS